MQITAQSQPTVKAFEKEEITCNQPRKQKCNYTAKQSIHAYTFENRKHIHNCDANYVNCGFCLGCFVCSVNKKNVLIQFKNLEGQSLAYITCSFQGM